MGSDNNNLRMGVEINDDRKISEIQEDFAKAFPFLKIVFYSNTDKTASSSNKYILIKNISKKIGNYRKEPKRTSCIIMPEQSVHEIELFFKEHYNLFVHVLRKSGKAWLEPIATGEWSLAKQNSLGEQLCAGN
jgi:hypothetical protein